MLIRSYVNCAIFGISMAEMYTGRIGMKGDVELRISDETAYFSGLEDTFLLVRKSDSGCSTLLLENEGTNLLLIVAYIAGGLLIVTSCYSSFCYYINSKKEDSSKEEIALVC